jgi:hypothetical protein
LHLANPAVVYVEAVLINNRKKTEVVARVLQGGPMDKAGIQSGDVLEAADGYPLNGGCSRELFAFHATFAGRKLDSRLPLRRKATRGSHSPDDIKKYAFVVVLQVGQLVGEVGEVVADASLQVLANMTIDRGQRAAAPLTYIR